VWEAATHCDSPPRIVDVKRGPGAGRRTRRDATNRTVVLADASGDTVAFGRALALLAHLAIIVCVFSLC
jgi:hypothetical protein